MTRAIDIHTHIIPREIINGALQDRERFEVEVNPTEESGCFILKHKQGFVYKVIPDYYDIEARLKEMKRRNLSFEVLSISPTFFCYWTDLNTACEVARISNDALEKWIQASPEHFKAFGTVPMQCCKSAVSEMEYAMSKPGFVGIEIGGIIEGTHLSDPRYLPFFEAAEALNALIFIHPYYVGPWPGLEPQYLTNLVGNPLKTTIAISLLILEGVLKKYPRLKIIAAHGGGFLPYGIGRIDHGYKVREETGPEIPEKPSIYMGKNIYCDCITHDPEALVYLKNKVGINKVLLGSDYPYDMGLEDPVGFIEQNTGLTELEKECILADNWLGLD